MVNTPAFTALLLALNIIPSPHKSSPGQELISSSSNFKDTMMAMKSQHGHGGDLSSAQDHSGAPSTENIDCNWATYVAPPILEQEFEPYDTEKAMVYRYRRQQSVNLGSWFVHEKWMTPTVFTAAAGPHHSSELDIASGCSSREQSRAILEQHWDTFINKTDFDYLADIGINTVRIPIGYWCLGSKYMEGTPFHPVAEVYQNCWVRLLRAINWAAGAGIGVLIDLHGAPGSQNGQPHSGQSGGRVGLFSNPAYMDKTVESLVYLATQLSVVNNLVGIQLLNEPANDPTLPGFYNEVISAMRNSTPTAIDLPIYIHDAFNLRLFSDYIANRTDFIVEDHHSYFVYTPSDQEEAASGHTNDVQTSIADELKTCTDKQRGNIVVDEWSCSLTNDSLARESDPEGAQKAFCTGQMEVYANNTAGWAFWSYKKEDCQPDWCFTAAVGKRLPPTFFSYPRYHSINLTHAVSKLDTMVFPRMSQKLAQFPTLEASISKGVPWPRNPRRNLDVVHQGRDSVNNIESLALRQANAQGYLDGVLTAKLFALHGLSMLGFTGQYMNDKIRKLGPNMISPGTENVYKVRFQQGLAEAQALIASTLIDLPSETLHKVHSSSTLRYQPFSYSSSFCWILVMFGLALIL